MKEFPDIAPRSEFPDIEDQHLAYATELRTLLGDEYTVLDVLGMLHQLGAVLVTDINDMNQRAIDWAQTTGLR